MFRTLYLISMFSYNLTVQFKYPGTISPSILGQNRRAACQSIRISKLEVTSVPELRCDDDHHGVDHRKVPLVRYPNPAFFLRIPAFQPHFLERAERRQKSVEAIKEPWRSPYCGRISNHRPWLIRRIDEGEASAKDRRKARPKRAQNQREKPIRWR